MTVLNAGRATIADLDKFEIEYIVKALENGDDADETGTTSSEQQTIPNLGPAEPSYSVGEPRCEDEDSAVEGCYDDPNNPLAEQTYRVGEPPETVYKKTIKNSCFMLWADVHKSWNS